MNKKFLTIFFVLFYILGLVAELTQNVIMYTFLVLFLIIVFILKKIISEKTGIVFFLIFAIGFFNCILRIKDVDFISSLAPQNNITVQGKVVSIPSSYSDEYTKFNFDVESFSTAKTLQQSGDGKIIVTLFAPKSFYKNIEIGDTLSLKGRLTKPKYATNPSEFCYATFLKYKNIFSRLFVQVDDVAVLSKPKSQPYSFLSSLNRVRNSMIDMHAKFIKSPELELLGGIVFGDDAVNPTPEMKDSFQHSGLTHIIAASGMNVTLIFGMWFFISQFLRMNYKLSIVIGMLSVICYTCMTGFGPPVLRATLMLLFILFGKLIDRKADSVSLLFIVAFLMLLFSPTMITNIGFQLSFMVTLGLLTFCPLIFDKIENKIVNTLLSFIIVPVIAQFFAAPIQMFYFNTFSPYSIFANIAVVPLLSFVSFIGFASCIFAVITPIATISVKLFDFLLMPFLTFITNIAEFFSKLPHSSVVVPSPSVLQLILYYLILFFILAIIICEKYRKSLFSIFVVGILALAISILPIFNQNKDNEIIFFNVDNADSALIKTTENKYIMIDTGRAPYKKFSTSAERIMLKYFEDKGIDTLDLLILSHYDSDHAGGTIPILNKIKVKKLIIRNANHKIPLADKILKSADKLNVDYYIPKNGEKIYSDGTNEVYSYFITSDDDNDSSIINLYKCSNGSILFTGDSGIKSFKNLKNMLPRNISVLKVPHHGAKATISDEYLDYLQPKVAIISTGLNIYGHPSDETISLLKKHSVKVLRTDKEKAVKVILHKGKILIYSYNNTRKKFERVEND